jgi:hypothetical protein
MRFVVLTGTGIRNTREGAPSATEALRLVRKARAIAGQTRPSRPLRIPRPQSALTPAILGLPVIEQPNNKHTRRDREQNE